MSCDSDEDYLPLGPRFGLTCKHLQLARSCGICELEGRISELEAEVHEQARLNGMGAERELALKAENERLREQLQIIAGTGTSQPAALNMPEADWYQRVAWNCIRTAARALEEK